MRFTTLAALGLTSCALAGASPAAAAISGGASYAAKPVASAPAAPAPSPAGPTVRGRIGVIRRGVAYAPASAPAAVKRVIWAGNRIRLKPYVYGGGHASFRSRGYDCSGSVSYALHGGGLLSSPLPSGPFMSWGRAGAGRWITIYTNTGHAWMTVAGLRFDTSGAGPSRWRAETRSKSGFRVRHPAGY